MMLNFNIFNMIIMLKIFNERNCVLIIVINNNRLKRFIKANLLRISLTRNGDDGDNALTNMFIKTEFFIAFSIINLIFTIKILIRT